MGETNVTVAAAGKTVLKGGRLDADARNRDVIGEPRPVHNDFNDAFRSAYYWFKTLYSALQGE